MSKSINKPYCETFSKFKEDFPYNYFIGLKNKNQGMNLPAVYEYKI